MAGLNGVVRADFWLPGNCNSSRLCPLQPDTRQQNLRARISKKFKTTHSIFYNGGELIGKFPKQKTSGYLCIFLLWLTCLEGRGEGR
jgi:hypothetical protein